MKKVVALPGEEASWALGHLLDCISQAALNWLSSADSQVQQHQDPESRTDLKSIFL